MNYGIDVLASMNESFMKLLLCFFVQLILSLNINRVYAAMHICALLLCAAIVLEFQQSLCCKANLCFASLC